MLLHRVNSVIGVVVLVALVSGCAAKSKPVASTPGAPAAVPTPSAPVTTDRAPDGAPAAPAAAPPAAGAAVRRQPPGPPPLTGLVTRAAMESFNDVWKGLRAQDYEPDPVAVAAIRNNAANVDVFAVVATWCPDTRRELPRFFKIGDQAGWPEGRVKLLAVDRTKKDAEGLTEKWSVTRVPTFIFLRGGQEIGRVVERPTTTLEQDIAEILTRK